MYYAVELEKPNGDIVVVTKNPDYRRMLHAYQLRKEKPYIKLRLVRVSGITKEILRICVRRY